MSSGPNPILAALDAADAAKATLATDKTAADDAAQSLLVAQAADQHAKETVVADSATLVTARDHLVALIQATYDPATIVNPPAPATE